MIPLKRLDIALTTSCNFHCAYCRGDPGRRRRLPLQEVIQIIDNFRDLGLRDLRLDGGEPFLYGDEFFAILAHAQARGMRVGVFTNASVLTHASVQRLKAHRDLELLVTIHTANREPELKATLDGLHLLASHGVYPKLFIIVSKNHLSTIEGALARLPQSEYEVTFRPVIPVGKAYENWEDGFRPLREEEKAAFRALLQNLSRALPGLKFRDESLNSNEPGYHHGKDGFILHVDTDGNLLPSFSSGADLRLGSAMDKASVLAILQAEETRASLERADLGILRRIQAVEKPKQPNVQPY